MAGIKQHARHGFKSQCECDFCVMKRVLTSYPVYWKDRDTRLKLQSKLDALKCADF